MSPSRPAARRKPGEGTFYTLPDGRKVGEASLGGRAGRRRVRVYGRADEKWKVVQDRLAVRRAEAARGLPAPRGRQTVAEYLDVWLEDVRDRLDVATWVNYESIVRVHLRPAMTARPPGVGDVRLDELAPAHVRRVLSARRRDGLGPGRVGQVLAVLRTALGDAERDELVDRNVARLVRAPARQSRETVPLDAEQAAALLAAMRGDRLYAFLAVGLGLGLRPGECLGLRWGDVDLERRELRVRRTLKRIGGQWLLEDGPKTVSSRQPLPLPEISIEALRGHRVSQLEERLSVDEWEDWGLVFCGPSGRPLWLPTVARVLERACDRAGVPRLTPHQLLRHGCAALLIAQGVDLKLVQRVLRHASYSVTADVYGHVLPQVLRDTVGHMDRLFGPDAQPDARPRKPSE